ncbi:DUF7146 domain-containing protein [Methylobacterium currus]|uniref:DUF7146 domain-containing protein n=1 Tax=Methylobacterium currus TaxID=2051553 RepID=UPI003B8326D0
MRPSDVSPGGFVVHSHAGDDWRLCRDHVATALGLATIWRQREADPTEVARRQEARRRAETAERQEAERLRKRAGAMWREAQCPVGTLVERYLNSRALELPRDVAGTVLRFHPACPWGRARHRR